MGFSSTSQKDFFIGKRANIWSFTLIARDFDGKIIGVSGTDCHNPKNDIKKLGKLVTWVYASELSAKVILEGLKKGNVFISLGPKLEFSVGNSEGKIAKMGEMIQSGGQPIELSISVDSDMPLRVVVIKNGLIFNSTIVHTENKIKFTDYRPTIGYYRVEFHHVLENTLYPDTEWRDFETIQALGNPIWVDWSIPHNLIKNIKLFSTFAKEIAQYLLISLFPGIIRVRIFRCRNMCFMRRK